MKKLAILPALVAALPAMAHEGGPIAHAHPHGTEAIAATVIAAALAAGAVWWMRRS
ncbi:hypothetical protein [Tropicimonas aquimaris]|uniref:Peptidase M23 n=1 Tax=Tropicimonas aquimaris TaxID=914152 RepID=A0ABW3IW92_9RHOB